MSDVTNKLIVWGVIVVISIIIAFICYRWISNVSGFGNRKKEIAMGMIVCVLVVSSFMFMPVLFSCIDLQQIGEELIDLMQPVQLDVGESNPSQNIAPFISLFACVLAAFSPKWISILIIVIPVVLSLLVILFVFLILLKRREQKKKSVEEYNRKHLFEYKSEILSKLNEDSER